MIPPKVFHQDLYSPYIRAWILACLSEYIYADQEHRQAGFRNLGFEELLFVQDKGLQNVFTDTEMSIVQNPELIVIVFRGSEPSLNPIHNLMDWINDFTMIKQKFHGTRVHRGFAGAFNAVWDVLEETIKKHRRGRPVWLTGHSLGGALAQLASYVLAKHGYPIEGVITFASPRVGGGLWEDAMAALDLSAKTELWINKRDPVPRIPFSAEGNFDNLERFPLWTHVGQIHYIHHKSNKISLFQNNPKEFVHLKARFGDHSLLDYIDEINQHMPTEAKAFIKWMISPMRRYGWRALLHLNQKSSTGIISLRQWNTKLGIGVLKQPIAHMRYLLP